MGVKITYSGTAHAKSPSAQLADAVKKVSQAKVSVMLGGKLTEVGTTSGIEVTPSAQPTMADAVAAGGVAVDKALASGESVQSALIHGLAAMKKVVPVAGSSAGDKPNALAAMFKKKAPPPPPAVAPPSPYVSAPATYPQNDLVVGFADGAQQVIQKEAIQAHLAEKAAMKDMASAAFEGVDPEDPEGLSKAMANLHKMNGGGVLGIAPPKPPEPYKALPPDQQAPFDDADPKAFKKVLASFYMTLTAPKGKKVKKD